MQWSYVRSECVPLYRQLAMATTARLFDSREAIWHFYQDVLILLVSPLVSLSAADEPMLNHNQKNLKEIGT